METHDINAKDIRDSFERFEEKSIHLKDLLDKRNKRSTCVHACVGCVCFPCIILAGCIEYLFGPKKKEDTLLEE
jgi:hypothetical protein